MLERFGMVSESGLLEGSEGLSSCLLDSSFHTPGPRRHFGSKLKKTKRCKSTQAIEAAGRSPRPSWCTSFSSQSTQELSLKRAKRSGHPGRESGQQTGGGQRLFGGSRHLQRHRVTDTGSGLGPPLLPDTCKPLGREKRTLRQLLLSSMEAPDLQVVAHIHPEQRSLPLYPHCAMWSTRAGLSLSLGPGLQKGCLGLHRVDIQGLPHSLPTCSSLTCVQDL